MEASKLCGKGNSRNFTIYESSKATPSNSTSKGERKREGKFLPHLIDGSFSIEGQFIECRWDGRTSSKVLLLKTALRKL